MTSDPFAPDALAAEIARRTDAVLRRELANLLLLVARLESEAAVYRDALEAARAAAGDTAAAREDP
jgi:hypothetical protein